MAILISALCAVPLGCNRRSTLTYNLGRKNGVAVLTIDKLTVVFEGAPFKGPDAESVSSGFVQVSGGGSASGGSSVNEVKLTQSYRDGIQRMSLNGYTFEIIDGGRTFNMNGKKVDVTRKGTVVVKQQGYVSPVR